MPRTKTYGDLINDAKSIFAAEELAINDEARLNLFVNDALEEVWKSDPFSDIAKWEQRTVDANNEIGYAQAGKDVIERYWAVTLYSPYTASSTLSPMEGVLKSSGLYITRATPNQVVWVWYTPEYTQIAAQDLNATIPKQVYQYVLNNAVGEYLLSIENPRGSYYISKGDQKIVDEKLNLYRSGFAVPLLKVITSATTQTRN